MSEQWKKICNEYSAHNGFLIEQIREKNEEILKYRQALKFGIKYLQASEMRQIKMVVSAMEQALAGESNETPRSQKET
ncbi:hypothetical protein [Oceanobacillus sp. CF4.6]|uniref:hypothetical protein n=1 Tax=Oceanobacillus sp. CF4.6 TaxID=3373080 RepID=UPI003EE60395